jgi:small subunit ribosomal protein S4e
LIRFAPVFHLCHVCRFATRISNVFVIGRGNKPLVTLPKGKGVRPTILQEQAKRFGSA